MAVGSELNTRVPHLEEETIFGAAKQKLNPSLKDDNDSYHHDHVNYSIPMVEKEMCLAHARNMLNASTIFGHSLSLVRSSTPLSLF